MISPLKVCVCGMFRLSVDSQAHLSKGWTRTHSYFTVMGGFIDSGRSRYTLDDRAMQRLTAKSHPEIISVDPPAHDSSEPPTRLATPWSQGHLPSKPWILVTESEILDKSKGDALGKLLTVTQIAWFIAQYLERWVTRRPRTHLEVMTLAYAALNILTYFLWWDKPLDVQEPIDISGRMFAIIYDRRKGPHGLWSILRDAFEPLNFTRDDWVSVTIFPVVGVLFGGVHCFAWHFPFPTDWEQTLWRVCSIYCTVSPFVTNGVVMLSSVGSAWADLSVIISVVVYAAARVVLLVLTFTCLRAPLPGIYEATPWTSYLPHFW